MVGGVQDTGCVVQVGGEVGLEVFVCAGSGGGAGGVAVRREVWSVGVPVFVSAFSWVSFGPEAVSTLVAVV